MAVRDPDLLGLHANTSVGSSVDRASFMCFIFIVVRLLFTYIFILYLVSIVLTSGVFVLYC